MSFLLHPNPPTLTSPSSLAVRTDLHGAQKVLVDPNGVGGAWAGANHSEATFPEDLQFVSDLLDEIRAGWCIDNSRID
jgi:hypothetical protein